MVSRPLRRDGPRAALVLVWLGTAAASLWDGGTHGQALLQATGLGASMALTLVWAGGLWDLAVGLWLACAPSAQAYRWALWGMLAMTALGTAWMPALWLDPLGPLLKNLAIAALLLQGLQRHTP